MKKVISAIVMFSSITIAHAQLNAGKKLDVVTNMKQTTTISQGGNDMDVTLNSDTYYHVDVKNVVNNIVSVSGTLTRIISTVNVMGNEQKFDSNDSSFANNPQLAEVAKSLNKPVDTSFSLNKLGVYDIATTGNVSSKYLAIGLFLPTNSSSWKENDTWSDSTSSDKEKTVVTYVVSKITADEITLAVKSNSHVVVTQQQAGMDIKTTMDLASTGTRVYSKLEAVMKSLSENSAATGVSEVMGQEIPVSTKGTITTIVK